MTQEKTNAATFEQFSALKLCGKATGLECNCQKYNKVTKSLINNVLYLMQGIYSLTLFWTLWNKISATGRTETIIIIERTCKPRYRDLYGSTSSCYFRL